MAAGTGLHGGIDRRHHYVGPADYDERRKIAEEFKALYAEIYAAAEPDSAVAEAAAALVAEAAPTRAPDFPPPSMVDWEMLAEDARSIVKTRLALNDLIAQLGLVVAQRAEDDDVALLLLLS